MVIAKGWGWVGNGELLFTGFPGGSDCNLSAVQELWVRSLGREDPLEKVKAIHSSVGAWSILWTEESGRLQSIGSQRIRHD